jgi:superfamily II DNA or RNA helicase
MCVSLVQAGIPAAVVSGATRPWTRRRLIGEFRSGAIRVLCNCEVLTAGFDAPLVTHVVVARPTVSLVLYQQMIGRGLRGPQFGGTERCVIINCIDRVKMGPLKLAHRRFRELWDVRGNLPNAVTDSG